MADELKDQRVVTMMSPSDLKAIDDWMFAHRIRSRGEAIRRLCYLGLIADQAFPALLRLANEKGGEITSALDEITDPENDDAKRMSALASFPRKAGDAVLDLIKDISSVVVAISPLHRSTLGTEESIKMHETIRNTIGKLDIFTPDGTKKLVKLLRNPKKT
ncbi:hypothetical protein ACFQU1_20650 [Chelatococcus sp. GCM10030263]|uniref:hypothetical protein n=1 Tax=Chelatococcus sp. GCM10030263 TaxID=3273387 RepID=UPI00360D970F